MGLRSKYNNMSKRRKKTFITNQLKKILSKNKGKFLCKSDFDSIKKKVSEVVFACLDRNPRTTVKTSYNKETEVLEVDIYYRLPFNGPIDLKLEINKDPPDGPDNICDDDVYIPA